MDIKRDDKGNVINVTLNEKDTEALLDVGTEITERMNEGVDRQTDKQENVKTDGAKATKNNKATTNPNRVSKSTDSQTTKQNNQVETDSAKTTEADKDIEKTDEQKKVEEDSQTIDIDSYKNIEGLEDVKKIIDDYNNNIKSIEEKYQPSGLKETELEIKIAEGRIEKLKDALKDIDTNSMNNIEMHTTIGNYKEEINKVEIVKKHAIENRDNILNEYSKNKLELENKKKQEILDNELKTRRLLTTKRINLENVLRNINEDIEKTNKEVKEIKQKMKENEKVVDGEVVAKFYKRQTIYMASFKKVIEQRHELLEKKDNIEKAIELCNKTLGEFNKKYEEQAKSINKILNDRHTSNYQEQKPTEGQSQNSETQEQQPTQGENQNSETQEQQPTQGENQNSETQGQQPTQGENENSETQGQQPTQGQGQNYGTQGQQPTQGQNQNSGTQGQQPIQGQGQNSDKNIVIIIDERAGTVTYKKEGKEVTETLKQIEGEKKSLFKRLNIKKIIKAYSFTVLIDKLKLSKRTNPIIIKALGNDKEALENYIKCLRDKREFKFTLIHKTVGLNPFEKLKLRKYTKIEKQCGAEIISKFDKNKALENGKANEKDTDETYKSVFKSDTPQKELSEEELKARKEKIWGNGVKVSEEVKDNLQRVSEAYAAEAEENQTTSEELAQNISPYLESDQEEKV